MCAVTSAAYTGPLTFTPEKKFYFIRHGRTDWHKGMIRLGPQDLSLNAEGIAEVKATIRYLDPLKITMIVTSSLKRCLETANLIAEVLKVPVVVDSRLQERDLGNWSFQAAVADDLVKDSPDGPEFLTFVKPKLEALLPSDAEPKIAFEKRIMDFFNSALFTTSAETVLVVAHGDIRDKLIERLNIVENLAGPKEFAMPIAFEPLTPKDWKVYKLK